MRSILIALLTAFTLSVVFVACKKLENTALGEGTTGPQTDLTIQVVNLKTNLPEPGVRIFISRKISARGEYQLVDTARTGANGEYKFDAPIPNDYKAYLDTTFYTADTAALLMNNTNSGKIVLKTHPKFGMAPVEISVIDSAAAQPLADFDMVVSYRPNLKPNFINATNEKTNADGKIIVSLPWPSEVKAKVADVDVYKADSIFIDHRTDNGTTATFKVPTLAAINVNLFDAADLQYLTDETVKFSIKPKGSSTFNPLKTDNTDEEGNVQAFATFPSEVKVEVNNLKFFKDTSFTVSLTKYSNVGIHAAMRLKAAAYSEPLLTNLQVSTLVLNNGITLTGPQDVTTDRKGNVYITDAGKNRIIKVDAKGNTTVLAGEGTSGKTDGIGTKATFAAPYGIRVANNGTLYVANNSSSGSFHAIRKIVVAADGKATVSTIAGAGAAGGADGVGTAATFNRAAGLALDKTNRFLYTAEWSGHRVRRIDLETNEVSTVAGSGSSGVVAGQGTDAKFQFPWGVALDASNDNLYVASWNGSAVHKIRLSDNEVTLIRKGTTANFNQPRGIFVTSNGEIMVANTTGHSFSKVDTRDEDGTSTFALLAGKHGTSGNAVGSAANARFNGPIGIWYDPYTGNWYIADAGNNQIKIVRSNDL